MADNHYAFDAGTPHGFKLRRALDNLERGLEELIDERDAMNLMIDGDGSQNAHFAGASAHFGFENTGADCKSAFAEINSALGKLTTNASVDNVNAAVLQLFNKLR